MTKPGFAVRHTETADFGAVIALTTRIYPESPPWTIEQLTSHQSVFPDGQFVAFDTDSRAVVGMAASLIVRWDDYQPTMNWRDFTSRGTFANHDPQRGRTLYGAEVMVDPTMQGQGIGSLLYDARSHLAEQLQLLRIRAGARLRGYHKWAGRLTAREYCVRVAREEIHDPTLSFQLRKHFRVMDVISGYLEHDAESQGWAALIEWLNESVATETELESARRTYQQFSP